MAERERRRAALFVIVCAALLAAAIITAAAGSDMGTETSRSEGRPLAAVNRSPARPRPQAARAWRLAEELRRSARSFLAAFFHYEVGETNSAVADALRAGATPGFAAQLLATPPRAPVAGSMPPTARLRSLQLSFVSATASRALISGSVRRGRRSEEFSFLFARRHGRWRASGPGQ